MFARSLPVPAPHTITLRHAAGWGGGFGRGIDVRKVDAKYSSKSKIMEMARTDPINGVFAHELTVGGGGGGGGTSPAPTRRRREDLRVMLKLHLLRMQKGCDFRPIIQEYNQSEPKEPESDTPPNQQRPIKGKVLRDIPPRLICDCSNKSQTQQIQAYMFTIHRCIRPIW